MFDDLVGQTLYRYRITRRIGEDSLGTVFKAHDYARQSDFTVKVINPALVNQPNFTDNFIQAARTAGRLDHPNLVRVFDFGETEGKYYIVMEHIPGENLAQILQTMRRDGQWLPLNEAVQIVRQLGLAMEYVRSQTAPQRVLRLANIMFKPVQSERLPYLPLLTDLGLHRLLEGQMVGENPAVNPAYLSPEASLGRATNARSDVYSLGILLFELVTGQKPFPVESLEDAVRYHTRQPLPPPRSIRPDLPEGLEQVIVKALEKNPEGRFSTPAVFATDLERVAPTAERVNTAPPAFESAISLLLPFRRSLGESPSEPTPITPPLVEDLDATQVNPVSVEAPQSPIDILLENPQLTVEPGGSVKTVINLHNQGSRDDNFNIMVEGLPAEWFSYGPQVVRLRPGEQRDVNLKIEPPRIPHSRAGRYSFTIRAEGQRAPGLIGETRGAVTVAAFSYFTSELHTPRLYTGDTGQIAINNLSNTQSTFTLVHRDPRGSLAFTPPQAQLRLEEGQSGVIEFRAELQQPRWIGGEMRHPYSAYVSASNGETQTHGGEIISRPVIPAWVLGALLFLFLCLGGSLAVFLSRSSAQVTGATATVLAMQTGTAAVALEGTQMAEQATAQFLADANDATIQAATATALWMTQQPVDTPTPSPDAFGTLQAIEATQTMAAIQGTVLAIDAFNQTSTAVVAAQQAATAQAQAAALTATAGANEAAVLTATAIANQAAALTATAAQAAILTATAQPSPTSPANLPRVLYLQLTDGNEARNTQALLQGNGFQVDILPLDAIPTANFTGYQVVIVGPDTGSQGRWGDLEGTQATRVLNAGIPIIGMGEGGYTLFNLANLPLGPVDVVADEGLGITRVDPASPVWTTPFIVPVPENQVIPLYVRGVPLVAVAVTQPAADMTLIARLPGSADEYPLIRQGSNLLWGFTGGPGIMTPEGQQVFVNVVRFMVPPGFGG